MSCDLFDKVEEDATCLERLDSVERTLAPFLDVVNNNSSNNKKSSCNSTTGSNSTVVNQDIVNENDKMLVARLHSYGKYNIQELRERTKSEIENIKKTLQGYLEMESNNKDNNQVCNKLLLTLKEKASQNQNTKEMKSAFQNILQQIQMCRSLTNHTSDEMIERLKAFCDDLNLEFNSEVENESIEIYISTSLYYIEIVLQKNGLVSSVKVLNVDVDEAPIDNPYLTSILRRFDLNTFSEWIKNLTHFYSLADNPKRGTLLNKAVLSFFHDLKQINKLELESTNNDAFRVLREGHGVLTDECNNGSKIFKLCFYTTPRVQSRIERQVKLTPTEVRYVDDSFIAQISIEKHGTEHILSTTPCVTHTLDENANQVRIHSLSTQPLYMSASNKSTTTGKDGDEAENSTPSSITLNAAYTLRLNNPIPMASSMLNRIRALTLSRTILDLGDGDTLMFSGTSVHEQYSVEQLICKSNESDIVLDKIKLNDKELVCHQQYLGQSSIFHFPHYKRSKGLLFESTAFRDISQIQPILHVLRIQATFNTLYLSCFQGSDKEQLLIPIMSTRCNTQIKKTVECTTNGCDSFSILLHTRADEPIISLDMSVVGAYDVKVVFNKTRNHNIRDKDNEDLIDADVQDVKHKEMKKRVEKELTMVINEHLNIPKALNLLYAIVQGKPYKATALNSSHSDLEISVFDTNSKSLKRNNNLGGSAKLSRKKRIKIERSSSQNITENGTTDNNKADAVDPADNKEESKDNENDTSSNMAKDRRPTRSHMVSTNLSSNDSMDFKNEAVVDDAGDKKSLVEESSTPATPSAATSHVVARKKSLRRGSEPEINPIKEGNSNSAPPQLHPGDEGVNTTSTAAAANEKTTCTGTRRSRRKGKLADRDDSKDGTDSSDQDLTLKRRRSLRSISLSENNDALNDSIELVTQQPKSRRKGGKTAERDVTDSSDQDLVLKRRRSSRSVSTSESNASLSNNMEKPEVQPEPVKRARRNARSKKS